MPQPLSERTASFTDSVIRRMTRVSPEVRRGEPVPGLPRLRAAPGDPGTAGPGGPGGPPSVLRHLGAQNFREALARKQSRYMGRTIDPDKGNRGHLRLHRGYDVRHDDRGQPRGQGHRLLPFYENYGADTILSGAEPIYVPLHPPAFTFDVDELEAAFRQRPKALVLCNPPTLRPGLHPGGAADHCGDGHQIRHLRHHR